MFTLYNHDSTLDDSNGEVPVVYHQECDGQDVTRITKESRNRPSGDDDCSCQVLCKSALIG
jgi:hypothetical protein